MKNALLSVIIPSRNDEFLQKTIDDLLAKAKEAIEIIVVLDGYWPQILLKDDARVIILHQGTVHNSRGMRAAINDGVALSRGKYIMKTDEHCMFDEGFDVKLKADCKDNWVVIPRRYRLDPEPDTYINIVFYFKPLTSLPPNLPNIPNFPNPPKRDGFTAVEISEFLDQ